MVAVDTSLIRSQSEFNNFIEPWENVATTEESFGNHRRLLRKYKHVCIFDEEEDLSGRVVNVEWFKKVISIAAHYAVSVANVDHKDDDDQI